MQRVRFLWKVFLLCVIVLISDNTVYANNIKLMSGTTFIEYINGSPDEYNDVVIRETVIEDVLVGSFVVTAYCPCNICCGEYSNPSNPTTSSGTIAKSNHTISADIGILPYGSEVIIDGQPYIVEDTGGGIVGNHIDMFFDTHSEALEYGKRVVDIYKQEEREVITVLKPVQFMEYMLITGDFMKRKIAESKYNKKTGNVMWTDSQGNILAARNKIDNGYENLVEEGIYEIWKRSR